ncbi:MAG: MFS transporter [Chloroflexota bacterium]
MTVFAVALPLLVIVGFFMVFLVTLCNITLQTTTPDALRGRVLSVFTTVFAGTAPIGSLFAGSVVEAFGVPAAFAIGGVASVGVVLLGCVLLAGCRSD